MRLINLYKLSTLLLKTYGTNARTFLSVDAHDKEEDKPLPIFYSLIKKINKSASWQILCLTCGLSVGVFKRLTNTPYPEYCASLEDEQLGDRRGCAALQCAESLSSASAEVLQVLTHQSCTSPYALFLSTC